MVLAVASSNDQDVDARDIGVRKHAVLRTAKPGHDNHLRRVLTAYCV